MANNALEDKDETGREAEMEKQWGGVGGSTERREVSAL